MQMRYALGMPRQRQNLESDLTDLPLVVMFADYYKWVQLILGTLNVRVVPQAASAA